MAGSQDTTTKTSRTVPDDTTLPALGYFFAPLGAAYVFISAEDGDEFSKFHGMQGILWGAVGFVLSFVAIGAIIWPIGNLFLAYKLYQGEDYRLPVLADFAEDQI